jgi:hypothetical protein
LQGSSAGSLIGAYFIADQPGMPQYGSSLYYDLLTGDLGKERFVDAGKILSLLGLKWLRWTPRGLHALLTGDKRPMINLPYLLQECVEVRVRPAPR